MVRGRQRYNTATIAAEHWRVNSNGDYSTTFTYDELKAASELNPANMYPISMGEANTANLYVTSSIMGNEYEIPKFEDGDKNVWYLNTIAVLG